MEWHNNFAVELAYSFGIFMFRMRICTNLEEKFFFLILNVRIKTSNMSVNGNVEKCEFNLQISDNWCIGRSRSGQSTCGHYYTFTFYFAQCLTHLRLHPHTHTLLHTTNMLSSSWKNLHIFLCTMTHLHIHEYTYTLISCFAQSHNKFENMLALSST